MSTGARSTEQWREHRALLEAIQRGAPAPEPPEPAPIAAPVEPDPESMPVPLGERIAGIVLGVAALLWIAAVVTGWQAEAAPVAALVGQVSLACGPLALIGIVYLLLQRTGRRESRRFGRTAAAMRAEATALEATVARLGARLDDERAGLTDHGQALLALGEDAALRLGEIGVTMRRETQALAHQSDRLEGSATGLFSDLGVVLNDLPELEGRIDRLGARLGDAGRDAQAQVTALSAATVRLATEAREADEAAGGAAQRLGAHLARIEGLTAASATRIDETADGIARTVDAALGRATEAVDATRASIDAQGVALTAMVDRSRAAFDLAGGGAAESFEARIAAVRVTVDALGERLAAHDAAGAALVSSLDTRVAAFEAAFAEADRHGALGAERMGETLRTLAEEARATGSAIARGGEATEALLARGEALRALTEETSGHLHDRLPRQLAAIEADATRGRAIIAALAPEADAAASGVTKATRAIGRIDSSVAAQRKAIEALAATAAEHFGEIERQARALDTLVAETATQADALSGRAAPHLVEALLRVRDTATQAAEHAARAFDGVIQDAAARLGEDSRRALEARLGDSTEARLAEIASLADRAAAAGEATAARLEAQVLVLGNAADSLERRQAGTAQAGPADEGEGVSARVAVLIDQLNAIAIDVTKLLTSDVPDTVWSAYLKGDRGIFTRRAARLVDTTEAREIARRYENEPTFHAQVDRYIHDFEAMLRHILSTRDGSMLGVTLLSADMGKLYVALAQAIERLRT